jgi:hypothetical protein
MRASEAAKIFVDDGMTDLMIFLSLVERVEEEGMAVQVHRLPFVSFARHHPETRHLPISRGYIRYCNDITAQSTPHHVHQQATGAVIYDPASPRCLSHPTLKLLGILTKTIEN